MTDRRHRGGGWRPGGPIVAVLGILCGLLVAGLISLLRTGDRPAPAVAALGDDEAGAPSDDPPRARRFLPGSAFPPPDQPPAPEEGPPL